MGLSAVDPWMRHGLPQTTRGFSGESGFDSRRSRMEGFLFGGDDINHDVGDDFTMIQSIYIWDVWDD